MIRHPIAVSLALPMAEFQEAALTDSIKAQGVIHPIVLCGDKVLDGWSRYQIATRLNLPFSTQAYTGPTDEPSLIAYLLAVNVHRRHYTALQRAILAARILAERRGPAKGGPQEFSTGDAARLFGVSAPYVVLCGKVLASKNTFLIKQVEQGKATREGIEEVLTPDPSPATGTAPDPKTSPGTAKPAPKVSVDTVIEEFEQLKPGDQRIFVERLIEKLSRYLKAAKAR